MADDQRLLNIMPESKVDLQQNMESDEERMRKIINVLSYGIGDLYTVDVNTKEVTVYRQAGDARGISTGFKQHMSYEGLIETYISHNVYADDRNNMREFTVFKALCAALKKRKSITFHYRVMRENELHYYYLKCARVGEADSFDLIVFAFVLEDDDVFEREMRKYMEIDELTGLYNRQAFYRRAQKLLDDNPDDIFDIAISDVANFKLINSVYGEGIGDEVIKYLGKFFLENTENGICARYGGDVFVGFAKSSPDRQGEWLTSLIERAKINSPVPNIVLKCGVYRNVDRSLSISAMCDRALLAVKSVKHNYTMPYATYAGPVSQRHLLANTYESMFDSAILNEEFVVYYQPQYNSATEEIVGIEALVRWQMSDGKFVSPGEFIPIFEENGLIARLDEYVFTKVCKKIKNWMDKGVRIIPISVNLSRASAFQLTTAKRYKEIADEIGVSPKMIPLELTESASIDNQRINEFMNELKEAGFELYLDDFGSGVSSLSCFNRLPFDEIKLDKSIIDCIGDVGGEELLRHIIELAHFKEMRVVAEGVEKKEQLDFLKELDCDVIQGFYFSKPLPYEELIDCLKVEYSKTEK
ncbi:MAG: EAL domain-containing protein [Lachnospiraceae bacterium]|nr:EAL domain-containing protein [Candidatus Colinaster scatohippi]